MTDPDQLRTNAALAARLRTAQAVTTGQDAKAANVLAAAGLLLTGGGVLTAMSRPTGLVLVLAALSAAALATAIVLLLTVLNPRGGSPGEWLLVDQEPAAELTKVAWIAGVKHQRLGWAVGQLTSATVLAALAVLWAAIR